MSCEIFIISIKIKVIDYKFNESFSIIFFISKKILILSIIRLNSVLW